MEEFLEVEEQVEAEAMSILKEMTENKSDMTSVSFGVTLTPQGENFSLNREAIEMLTLPRLIT